MYTMRDFERKKKMRAFKRRIYSLPVLIPLLIVVAFTLRNVWLVGVKSFQTEAAATKAHEELASLEDREVYLEGKIDDLNEPFGIEAAIREKYGYVKEGEEMVIVVDEKRKTGENTEQEDGDMSFFEKILDWF